MSSVARTIAWRSGPSDPARRVHHGVPVHLAGRFLLCAALFAPALLERPAAAASFTVNSTADTPDANPGNGICDDGTGACTLRAVEGETAALANAFPCPDPLPEDHVILAISGTVSAASPFSFAAGQCTRTVDITGPGASVLTIAGGGFRFGASGVAGESASLSGVTISGAEVGVEDVGAGPRFSTTRLSDAVLSGNGTGIRVGFQSAVIVTDSRIVGSKTAGIDSPQFPGMLLHLTNSSVDDNEGPGISGFIIFIEVTRSTVRRNAGFGIFGGGVASPTITVIDSLIEANDDTGIRNETGQVHLNRSTVSGNLGGGLAVLTGPVTLLNSTISGNESPGDGGGVLYFGTSAPMQAMSSTIALNTADSDGNGSGDGGGIFVMGGDVMLANTIVGANVDRGSEAPDCFGQLVSEGHNLLSNAAGCLLTGPGVGDIVGAAPLLGPLADNGGATPTHALLVGSPAIDAGDPTGCKDESGSILGIDQRGFPRPQGAACDVGAFEQTAPDAALAMCVEDLSECRALIPDADGDGEVDGTDRCSETPPGEAVDDAGCSRAQFCASVEATTREGKRACRRADWRNDEPLVQRIEDCAVAKGASGSDDDRCVPSE